MVEFVVRVPGDTPDWVKLFLAGDGPLGDWSADATPLDRWDDGTHHARLNLPTGWHGRFLVTPGRWRDAEANGNDGEVAPRELVVTGSTTISVNVAGWNRNSVRYHTEFPSKFLKHPRTLAVYVPPGYDLHPAERFPVLYMHDGQNLFDADTAFGGQPWWADEVAERVIRAGRVRPVILVGVANTPDRLREYGPKRSGKDKARDYGRFLVEEVKPFIDATYRTLPGWQHTGTGGSSMGGLISLHLSKWYPGVFGLCAAMSASLWWDGEWFLRDIDKKPGWLNTCRVWLDMGRREGGNPTVQKAGVRRAERLAAALKANGIGDTGRVRFLEIPDGEHNEAAWGARFDRVLEFLFPAV